MTLTLDTKRSAGRIAKAASAFLETLSHEQRLRIGFSFDSDERGNWHYVPMPRNGLPRGDLDQRQIEASEELIASSMSGRALKQTLAIFEHELILGRIEGSQGTTWFDRDPGLYYFSVFGDPAGEEPWGWRVEGHHVSLNLTIAGGEVVSPTPCFLGANPAEVRHGPAKGLRILTDEEDLARRLLLSLDPLQRGRAVIYPVAPREFVSRAGRRVEIDRRAGLPASLMSADQREALMSLVRVYVTRKPYDIAGKALKKIEDQGVGEILFAWAGSEHRGQCHYYRLHGPSFFVEYDNTQDMANHIHSVWRDTEDDFGYDPLRLHYEASHT